MWCNQKKSKSTTPPLPSRTPAGATGRWTGPLCGTCGAVEERAVGDGVRWRVGRTRCPRGVWPAWLRLRHQRDGAGGRVPTGRRAHSLGWTELHRPGGEPVGLSVPAAGDRLRPQGGCRGRLFRSRPSLKKPTTPTPSHAHIDLYTHRHTHR